MSVTHKDLAQAVIQFLKNSVADKTVNEEFAESIDVAIDCIGDAFEVDKDGSVSGFGGKTLLEFVNSGSASSASAPPADKAAAVAAVSPETKEKADALKAEGNKAMAAKDFATAIAKYTEAILLDPLNVVYLSNRAAAHSSASKHDLAVEDATAAIALEPSFSKAYSRLGLAQYALGNAKASMEAYKKGIDVEGASPSDAMKRGYETAKKRVEEELESLIATPEATTDRSAGAGTGAGAGAGAGAGGMPDLASMFGGGAGGMPSLGDMMNNPQVMQAAQSLMLDPNAMLNLMNNPMLRLMAENFGGAEGGLDNLMNNPMLQNMARQFMGGQNGQNGQNEQNPSN